MNSQIDADPAQGESRTAGTKRLSITIAQAVYDAAEQEAQAKGVPVSRILGTRLDDWASLQNRVRSLEQASPASDSRLDEAIAGINKLEVRLGQIEKLLFPVEGRMYRLDEQIGTTVEAGSRLLSEHRDAKQLLQNSLTAQQSLQEPLAQIQAAMDRLLAELGPMLREDIPLPPNPSENQVSARMQTVELRLVRMHLMLEEMYLHMEGLLNIAIQVGINTAPDGMAEIYSHDFERGEAELKEQIHKLRSHSQES